MTATKIVSMAAVFASLAVAPAFACDYSHEASNVSASATSAPAVEVQAAAVPTTAAPATEPATAQTTETATVATPQPKLN